MTLGKEIAGRPRGPWRGAIRGNVLMMGLVSLLTDFSSEMMNPLLPVFVAGLTGSAWAAVVVGVMEGIAETTASLVKVFSGRISDRLGKRKAIVVGGYGVSTLARPAMALAPAASVLAGALYVVAAKFVDRIGKGLRTSPRDALIGDSVDDAHRGLAFSFHRAMDHAGAILGPLASVGILYLLLGYAVWRTGGATASPEEMSALRWLFGLAVLPGLAAVLVLVAKVREIAPRRKEEPLTAGIVEPAVWKRLGGRFYAFVGIVSIFALGNSSDMFLMLYAWQKFQLGLTSIIALWVALHLSKIFWSLPGGALSDRFGRRPVIVAGWAAYALVYMGLALADQQWQFWALLLAYGFYYGMSEGVEKALVADMVPSEHRGTAFGLYHGAVGIAALPASLMFGVFWKYVGPTVAFGVGAALAGLAAVLLTLLLARDGRAARRA